MLHTDNNIKKVAATFVLFALPAVAFAVNLSEPRQFVQELKGIVNTLIGVLLALAVVVFFWGLVKYIRTSEKGHAEGINIMKAGLVSIFVMVSLWGIITLGQEILGVESGNQPLIPPSIQGR